MKWTSAPRLLLSWHFIIRNLCRHAFGSRRLKGTFHRRIRQPFCGVFDGLVFRYLLHGGRRIEKSSKSRFGVVVAQRFHILPPSPVPLVKSHDSIVEITEGFLDESGVVCCFAQHEEGVVDVGVVENRKLLKKRVFLT